jgi:hypothetical protein
MGNSAIPFVYGKMDFASRLGKPGEANSRQLRQLILVATFHRLFIIKPYLNQLSHAN